MPKESYNVIGVMSGTSLDGIDLAHIAFEIRDGKWAFEIRESETVAYSPAWVDTLQNAVTFGDSELEKLDSDYTELLGGVISKFIERHDIRHLDAVCSHGHTILHQPQHGITLQIGNLPQIAETVAQTVVCDFRVDDVKLGGQGAPLVPIGDRMLFPQYDYCLNLGGFSNVSFENQERRLAFDISPVNTVLNFYANRLGHDFDDDGKISATGKIDYELLHELNSLEFYAQPYPKSLGFEFVRETILPMMQRFDIPDANQMRTFSEHIAVQIASTLPKKSGKMLITGGGAYNGFLISRIQEHLPQIRIEIPDSTILEFKEALIFGLLGVLKIRNEINVLSSVTGAERDHSSGKIHTN